MTILKPTPGVTIAFTLALAVRICSMLLLQTWDVEPANNHWAAGWETGRIADHLARGEGFALGVGGGQVDLAPTAWLAPLYPLLVGGVFKVFGSFTSVSLVMVLLFQVLCDGLTCVVLARLGRVLGRGRVGLLAAYTFALSPAAISISTRVFWGTSLLTLLCLVLVLRMLVHGQRESTWKNALGTGVLIGLCLLTSPTPAIFIGVAGVWIIARRHGEGLRSVSVMALVALVMIAPWIVRGERILGSYFFIKSNVGNELFIGNNPLADGSYIQVYSMASEVLSPPDFEVLPKLNELERSRALGVHARAWIVENPGSFLSLSARRAWGYWTASFLTDWAQLPLGALAPAAELAYSLGKWLVLLAAAIGVLLLARGGLGARLIPIFLVTFPLAYYVTHVSISRYRFPVVPLVFYAACVSVDALWRAWERRREALL